MRKTTKSLRGPVTMYALIVSAGIVGSLLDEPNTVPGLCATAVVAFLGASWLLPVYLTRHAAPGIFLMATVGTVPARVGLALLACGFALTQIEVQPVAFCVGVWSLYLWMLIVEIWFFHCVNENKEAEHAEEGR